MNNALTPRRLRTATIAALAGGSLGGAALVEHATDAHAAGSKAKAARATARQAPTPPDPSQEDARLAKALGVSEDQLKAARAKVRSDELDDAVKAGKLTSKQQDLIEQLRATGLDFPLPPGVGPTPGSGTDPDTALAKALGISVDKVRDARPTPPKGGPAGGPPAPPTPQSGSTTARGKRTP